ncbi:hypothetical protein QBC44DRAFT_395427 [Cladorrhinum sp. PSN332]|nr:hypothetical protein QBC44DRAFT_395427 [Cladorrhinum sp. PSN332]
MLPHMTALSLLGNHVGAILYDAKWHKLGIFGQESGDWNYDHGMRENTREVEEAEQGNEEEILEVRDEEEKKDEDEDEDEGDGEEGEDDEDDEEEEEKEEEEEGEYGPDWNEYGELMMNTRSAGELLRDMNKWYLELRETPGGGDPTCVDWNREMVKPLYVKHGWPGLDFDGDAFLVDLVRARTLDSVKYSAEEPLRQVQCYKGWLASWDFQGVGLGKLGQQVSGAKTVDGEWLARWELWSMETRKREIESDLTQAEEWARISCPGGNCLKDEDLPIMELKQLATEYRSAIGSLEEANKFAELVRKGEREPYRGMEAKLRQVEQEVEIVKKSYEGCKADAERLCPGQSLSFLPVFEKYGADLEALLKKT